MCNTAIAPLSQRDARWSAKPLGNSNGSSTIGNYGCLVTCFGMLCGLTPDVMNTRMKPKGFQPTGSGCPACAATFDIKPFYNLAPALLSVTKSYPSALFPKTEITRLVGHLRDGHPAIVEVDMIPYPRNQKHDQHFALAVAAYGFDGAEQIVINDPWYGDQTTLTPRYGTTLARALVRVIYYK